jgi:hypothetical protein
VTVDLWGSMLEVEESILRAVNAESARFQRLSASIAIAMVEATGELAREAGVNVFRRFAFIKGFYEVEQVSFDRRVDPNR